MRVDVDGQTYEGFYNDGPDFPSTPELVAAEKVYRDAYLAGAREAARWQIPDAESIAAAWEDRGQAKERACVPAPHGRFIYHLGHCVPASRTRGRCQALEMASQCWESLSNQGVPDELVAAWVLEPWAEKVAQWVARRIDPDRICPPPAPEHALSPAQLKALVHAGLSSVPLSPPISTATAVVPAYRSVRELLALYPDLRPPVIHNLLRQGETLNVIAPPKTGKSWLVIDLALAAATGRPWLDRYETTKGNILVLDNELHGETTANRIPRVAAARGVPLAEVADTLFVENVRGRLRDIVALGPYFEAIEPGRFQMVVIDAFYRILPHDGDENSNSLMAQVYNQIDAFAARLKCAFVLVHHSSKGSQSYKSVVDTGAGAGAQSRAADSHLVLRPHEVDGVVVLDAAVRSWPPIEPLCLRWDFPIWRPVEGLDPTALRPERPRRKARKEEEGAAAVTLPEPQWDTDRFVTELIGAAPKTKDAIFETAERLGLSEYKAAKFLKRAEAAGKVFRWHFGSTHPVGFATAQQTLLGAQEEAR
jgi:hypothetical protein